MNRKIFLLFLIIPFASPAQSSLSGSFSARAFGSSENRNSFWIYSNQYGRIDKNTDYLGLGNIEYRYSINEQNQLQVGAGALLANGNGKDLRTDELYARYTFKNFRATVGLKHRDLKLMGLSSVGGDILWSDNARAIPSIILGFVHPVHVFKGLRFNASLGHYLLGDDRFVKNTQVHFKDIQLIIDLGPRDLLSLKLSHYAQYGGTSPQFGAQPDGFSDYLKIFFGSNGGRKSIATDQQNALGNHIGSYELVYALQRKNFDLKLYHQTIFEDTSGRELSNFPDGVWGAYFQPKNSRFIKAILYEYVQTVSQSGRFGKWPNGSFSGGDNYFYNGIYRSGWTYKSRIIGLPFIIPAPDGLSAAENRFYVHHLGIAGQVSNLDVKFKGSYVKNLGTYTSPLKSTEHALYTFLEAKYPTTLGDFNLILGADYSDKNPTVLSAGLGYEIQF